MLGKLKAFLSSRGLALRCWQLASVLAAALLIFSLVQFWNHYRDVGRNLMETGRRVEISVPDGAIKSRETLAALSETSDEEREQKREEAFQQQRKGEGAVTGTEMEKKEGEEKPATTEEKSAEEKPATENPSTPEGEAPKEASGEKAEQPKDEAAAPVAAAKEPKEPQMVIIVSGVGLSRSTVDVVFTLPAVVTLSFSSYAAKVEDLIKEAGAQGYEVLLDLPLEPTDYPLSDPGPLALLTSMNEKQNVDQIDVLLSLSEDITAFLAPHDEQFTYSVKSISPVLGYLADKKMPLVYEAKAGNYFLSTAADQLKASVVSYSGLLDDVTTPEAIKIKLDEAADKAKKEGGVVVVARPYPVTVDAINQWLASPEARGLRVVPLSKFLAKDAKDAKETKDEPDGKKAPASEPTE